MRRYNAYRFLALGLDVHLRIVLFIALAMVAVMAQAAAPPDADPALGPFFGSLSLNGVSCCSLSDCRAVQARIGVQGWEAHIRPEEFPGATEDQWVMVPSQKIVHGKNHPYGLATACWTPYRGLMCFTEPPGA